MFNLPKLLTFPIALKLLTVIEITAYILAGLVPYVDSLTNPIIIILGILFPFLACSLILTAIIWLFANKRWSLLCFIIFFIGWKSIISNFAFNFPEKQHRNNYDPTITIISYNVHQFKPSIGDWENGIDRFIKTLIYKNADILCLQEFNNSQKPGYMAYNNLNTIKTALRMQSSYFSRDYQYYDSLVAEGTAIFTKFPVLDSGKIMLNSSPPCPSVIYLDLLIGADTLRIMNTHLESFGLSQNHDSRSRYPENKRRAKILPFPRQLSRKIVDIILIQNQQATELSDIVKSSPYPVILCGDLNSTPNTLAYNKIKGNLQDAFIQAGFGMEPTYWDYFPKLRIDYIFVDPTFKISSFETGKERISDHYPIQAKIILR